jgi:hypothetical protein
VAVACDMPPIQRVKKEKEERKQEEKDKRRENIGV